MVVEGGGSRRLLRGPRGGQDARRGDVRTACRGAARPWAPARGAAPPDSGAAGGRLGTRSGPARGRGRDRSKMAAAAARASARASARARGRADGGRGGGGGAPRGRGHRRRRRIAAALRSGGGGGVWPRGSGWKRSGLPRALCPELSPGSSWLCYVLRASSVAQERRLAGACPGVCAGLPYVPFLHWAANSQPPFLFFFSECPVHVRQYFCTLRTCPANVAWD